MTDAERIEAREKQIAAAAPGGFGVLVADALAALGKPDSVLMGQIRHALTAFGVVLAGGYIDNTLQAELIGAVMIIVGDGWSILAKYITTRWFQIAVQTPASTTMPQLAAIAAATPAGPVTAATVETGVITQVVPSGGIVP